MNIVHCTLCRFFVCGALLLGYCQFFVYAEMPSEQDPNTFADWQYQEVSVFYDGVEYRENPLGAVVYKPVDE